MFQWINDLLYPQASDMHLVVEDALKNCGFEDIKVDLIVENAESSIFVGTTSDAQYIVKVMNIYDSRIFKNELKQQELFYKAGIGPQIYCSSQKTVSYDKHVGIIVMDQMTETMDTFLKVRRDKAVLTRLVKDIMKLLEKMCKHKLAHGDLHWGNIAYKDDIRDLMFIDFGWSSDEGCVKEVELLQLIRTLAPQSAVGMNLSNRLFLTKRFIDIYNKLYPLTSIENIEEADSMYTDFVFKKYNKENYERSLKK